MRKFFSILSENNNNPAGILYRVSLMAVAFTLPLNIYFNSIAIILLVFAWLIEGNFSIKIKLFRQRPLIAVFILFYILYLAGMFCTSNIPAGRFELEKKLSLLVLPLVLGTSVSITEKVKETVLKVFVLSSFIAALVCLSYGLYRYRITGNADHLFYMDLASVLTSHAIYFAMYLCFSVIILVRIVINEHALLPLWKKTIIYFLILFFFSVILLLSARIVMLFIALYFTALFIYGSYRYGKFRSGLVILFLLAIIGGAITMRSGFLRSRFTQLLESDFSAPPEGKNANGLTIRVVKWQCSIEGIMEYPLTGTGTGDAVDYLVECYKRKNFWGMYDKYRYNSHNQFLQTGLTLGLPGLTCFLIAIILPLIPAVREKRWLLPSLLVLFCFCCLTESMLERHQGIVFFTFFVSMLGFSKSKCT